MIPEEKIEEKDECSCSCSCDEPEPVTLEVQDSVIGFGSTFKEEENG